MNFITIVSNRRFSPLRSEKRGSSYAIGKTPIKKFSIILLGIAILWGIAVITPGPKFFMTARTTVGQNPEPKNPQLAARTAHLTPCNS